MPTISQSGLSLISNTAVEGTLRFQAGPFNLCLKSDINSISQHVYKLYPQNRHIDEALPVDFYIEIFKQTGIRRWVKPQVIFSLDGYRPFTPLPLNQAPAQFEWGLNWCIASQMHQYLIIHSAVVEKHGISIILPGSPGSGKSTLCAGLVNRGWRLLSDEMALVSLQNLDIQPIPRPVSLKNNSINIIKHFAPDSVMGEIIPNTTKGNISHMLAPQESVLRQHETAKLSYIIFPKYNEKSQTVLTEKPKAQACMSLIENTFNFNILGEQGFDAVTDIIDKSICFDFTYPDLNEAIFKLESLFNPTEK